MICCRGAAAADRRAAIDRYFLAAGSVAANPHQRRAPAGRDRLTNGQTDGRTNARQTHRPRPAYYVGGANNMADYRS